MPHGHVPQTSSYLPPGQLDGHRSCLTLTSLGPAHASLWPVQAQVLPPNRLSVPETSSSQPLQSQLLPNIGLFRHGLCLGGLSRPLQAQLLHPGSFSRPRTFSSPPSQAQLLPPVSLCRVNLCLSGDFLGHLGQAPAFQQPLQAQLLPLNDLSRASSCLTAAILAQLLPVGSISRPRTSSSGPLQAFLKWASPGSALPPGCISRPISYVTTTSFSSALAQLLAAFIGPKLSHITFSSTTFLPAA